MPVKLSGGAHEDEEDARIEVVPLIDIMFFLLASFMLVSLSMTHINRVNLNLPTMTTSSSDNQTPPIHLAIDPHGVTTWDMAVVTPTEITDRLKTMAPADDTRVMIGADEEARHKQVIAVLDAVKAAGIDKVSFETKNPNP